MIKHIILPAGRDNDFDNSVDVEFTQIRDHAFDGASSLIDSAIPSTTSYLGSYAYNDASSLTTVSYSGSSITEIKEYTFQGTSSLNNLNKSLNYDVVIFDEVISIGQFAFANSTAMTSMQVGVDTTSVLEHAFENTQNLAKIDLWDTKTLGDYAFNKSNLSNLVVQGVVETIG
jgi:hypothetical protein